MSLNSVYKFFGLRKSLITRENLHDYVEVLCWKNPWLQTGHHLSLRVIKQGKEVAYFSFLPIDWTTAVELPMRVGVEAFFMTSYQEEALYQGFRNSWPAIADDLSEFQRSLLQKNSIRRVADANGLRIAQAFPEDIQEELRQKARPEVVILRSLNLDAVIREINAYTSSEAPLAWTSWGKATLFGRDKVHNCGSIVLDILYKGGMGNLLTSSQDLMGLVGLMIAGCYAFEFEPEWRNALLETGVGFFAGRFLGGMYEGYTGIQSFLNLLSAERKDNVFTLLGLRLLSTTLSGLLATVKTGMLVPAVLVTPRDVMNLTNEALKEEEALYSHVVPKEVPVESLTTRLAV